MRSSTVMATLFGGLAIASPILRERKEIVEVEVVTVVTTITAGSQPTPPPVAVVTVAPTPPKKAEFFGVSTEPAAPPPSAVASPAPSTGGTTLPVGNGPPSTLYKDVALWHHNVHRANHSAPALTWSDSLAASALTVAQTCVYEHKTDVNGGGYGQNIAAGAPPSQIANIITDMMYNGEIGDYPGYGAEPSMANFHKWGHFSQIIWAGSTEVGCATFACGSLANAGASVDPFFTVCNYKTPGNFGGQYSKNVLAPKGNPTVTAATKAT